MQVTVNTRFLALSQATLEETIFTIAIVASDEV